MSDELTAGEIGRALKRIEESIKELREDVRPVSMMDLRLTNAERAITRIGAQVGRITTRAAAMTGGLGVVIFIVNWFRGH